ncbi:MAG: hypothetical protein QG673_737 [Pseudomonadota bacterium]|nr:hypothetical protein [Pseudomonadota bacterium]
MKKILLTLGILCSKLVFAAVSIAVPDLVYENNVTNYGINNTDVRGALIKSGKFKIIHTPKDFNVEAAITTQELASHESAPTTKSAADNLRYILVGQVVTADLHDNYYSLQNTTNNTGTRTLNISVNYKLLSLKDKTLISSFNINASASQTAILRANTTDKLQTNQGKLVKDISQDLATQVASELSQADISLGEYHTTKFQHYDE